MVLLFLSEMANPVSNRLISLTKITLVSIMLVIVAGGIVRMSGSGMGCPDWPKCFEQYIPPTDVSQLPDNYKEIYSAKRDKKINRFADFLAALGLTEVSEQIRNDRSLREEQDFNAANTWTEYGNRLTGAIAGLLVFITFLMALAYIRKRPWLFVLCGFQIILFGFQAWMGAMTVATSLTPWVLTAHMLIAILNVALQLKIIRVALGKKARTIILGDFQFKGLMYAAIVISSIQIIAGTGVRQLIDGFEGQFPRTDWIAQLGANIYFHRSFSIAVTLVAIGIMVLNVKRNMRLKEASWLLVIVLAEALVGIGLAYAGMPAILQPIHLVLSIVMIGIQIHIVQKIRVKG
ncbi:MAG: COX15/CtaA family protein [Flavobacteriales bacterium]|nr:COX15/CtaA family protein [Flavobacteriales bacterium]